MTVYDGSLRFWRIRCDIFWKFLHTHSCTFIVIHNHLWTFIRADNRFISFKVPVHVSYMFLESQRKGASAGSTVSPSPQRGGGRAGRRRTKSPPLWRGGLGGGRGKFKGHQVGRGPAQSPTLRPRCRTGRPRGRPSHRLSRLRRWAIPGPLCLNSCAQP